MRFAFAAAGVLLAAAALSAPAFSAPDDNAVTKRHSAPAAAAKKKAVQPLKRPTWEDCYAMSRQRGFDHDTEEWLQSITDCQEGKIPL
jgi:hypothetical protein